MSTYIIDQCQDVKNINDFNRDNFHRYLSQNKKKNLISNNSYIVTNNTPKLKRTKTAGLQEFSTDSLKSS